MLTELIFTGSELMQGRSLNTHAQYLGRWLTEHNFEVAFIDTVGDQAERLAEVFRQALKRSDLILISGGLGPTTDDLTKETIAQELGLPMRLDHESLTIIKGFFAERGVPMPDSNTKQAYFPAGGMVLPNKLGTAPGVLLEIDKKIIVLLPGPPRELTAMFEEIVAPILLEKANFKVFSRVKTFMLTGVAESAAQDKLLDLGGQTNPGIAYLTGPGQLTVRLAGRGPDQETADKLVKDLESQVRARMKEYIFQEDDECIEIIVGQLLQSANKTVSVAESCTGGMIAARLIDVPGSSAYVDGGVVAYSNEVKINVLGVDAGVIETWGAVSRETAEAMANGVRNLTHSDVGLAVTGVAGPDGGTPNKPVGLVYIALTSEKGVYCKKCQFPGNRQSVRTATMFTALNMIKTFLIDNIKKSDKFI